MPKLLEVLFWCPPGLLWKLQHTQIIKSNFFSDSFQRLADNTINKYNRHQINNAIELILLMNLECLTTVTDSVISIVSNFLVSILSWYSNIFN